MSGKGSAKLQRCQRRCSKRSHSDDPLVCPVDWSDPGMIVCMYISAKVDYAIRALCGLAASDSDMTSAALTADQNLPEKFLGIILNDLRRADLVVSRRGPDGGYLLSRPASEIRLTDVIRPLEGPLAEVRGLRPEAATYEGAAESLQTVWVAVRASLCSVLEKTTIADVVSGRLPRSIRALTADPDSWVSRPARYQ
jgi:Rrf2 family protein